jgi:AraC family transcriptional regulator
VRKKYQANDFLVRYIAHVRTARTETANYYRDAIEKAIAVAFASAEIIPDAKALAQAAGFSAFHFSRMFTGMVGESPGEFLRRLRLERAAYQLQHGERVTEAALDAGYDSPEAFARAFRLVFGCAPSAFGEQCTGHHLPTPNGLHYNPDGTVPRFVPQNTLNALNAFGENNMTVNIHENIPAQRVIALRHTGSYNNIGAAFGQLAARGFEVLGAVGIYYDDPETTPEAELRSDACAIAPENFTPSDSDLRVVTVAGGRYAVYTYLGDYSGISAAWGKLMGGWVPTSGQTMDFSRPCFEVYVNDCDKVPVEEVRTDLYQPIV